jgi:TolB protein
LSVMEFFVHLIDEALGHEIVRTGTSPTQPNPSRHPNDSLLRRMAMGILCTLSVIVVLPSDAYSKLVIPVDKPRVGRMPIGVPNFQIRGQGPEDGGRLAMILRNDLFVTGLFQIVENVPSASIREDGEPEFEAWSKVGAQTLVTGTVSYEGDEIIFEGRLYHVALRKIVMGKRLRARVLDHRLLIHRFADRIMQILTQVPGCFSSQIAFVGASKPGELYIMDFDGHNLRQVTRTAAINLSPRWAPDGGGILFTSYVRGTPDLWFQPLSSTPPRVVSARKGLNASGRFSPDGRMIAASLSFQRTPHIYLLTPDGNIIKRLTDGIGNDISPTWSPDGSTIAYVSDPAGTPQIYTIPLSGGQPRRVTFESNYNTDPDWSPAGDLLAFTAKVGGRFQICTMRTD